MGDDYRMQKMKRIFFIAILCNVLLWGSPAFSMEQSWGELHQKAEKLRSEKKYSKALKIYKALLQLTQETYGGRNAKVAEVLVEISLLHRYDLGDEEGYAEFQEKAKRIQLTLNGAIGCKEPKDWAYEPCRERWLGQDPCFVFRNVHDYIKVTYYGLAGSGFKKPEDFIGNLRDLFGKFEDSGIVELGGREATRIILRYEQRRYHDPDGGHLSPRFLYEEFLILPLEKGFLVLNLKLSHLTPIPLEFTREDAPKELYGAAYDEYQTWVSFTESCRIDP